MSKDDEQQQFKLLQGGRRKSDNKPTKQRPEDQQLPEKNNFPFVADELGRYLEYRKQIGIQRYGTPLQPHNGRDVLLDLFEELIDATTYFAQMIIERDGKLPEQK